MKKLLVLLFIVSFSAMSHLSAANYKLDDAKVDSMFETAHDVSFTILAQDVNIEAESSSDLSVREKDPIAAALLALFIPIGIHRFYLGTETLTGLGYIATSFCCGFGTLVSIIDGIVLLVNSHDISKYIDNPRFFMW